MSELPTFVRGGMGGALPCRLVVEDGHGKPSECAATLSDLAAQVLALSPKQRGEALESLLPNLSGMIESYETELAAERKANALLRDVVTVAELDIAARGKVQERTALHTALAAYYRHLAERAKARPDPPHQCFAADADAGVELKVHGDPNMSAESLEAIKAVGRAAADASVKK